MDDYAASTSTTGSLSAGSRYLAFLEEEGDHDWFRVELTAGHTYVFEAEAYKTQINPYAMMHLGLALRDSTGAMVAFADDAGSGASLLGIQASTSGTFYIDAGAVQPPPGRSTQYFVTFTDLDQGRFEPPNLRLTEYGSSYSAGGWLSDDRYPRRLADFDGDGVADLVGFGERYVTTADSWVTNGYNRFSAYPYVSNETREIELGEDFTAGQGWTSNDLYPRELADVDGDGRPDIVGFGEDGVWVALKTASGIDADRLVLQNFGASASAGGWSSDDRYHRTLADLNGDGRADIVGFGENGVWTALADGTGGFGESRLTHANFGASAGAWTSDDRYHREMADVNGDGFADIVGFGENGVWVALGEGTGGFGQSRLVMQDFGVSEAAGGWVSDERYPRRLGDVNGDGFADIVGFGEDGVWVALADGTGGFAPSRLERTDFGASAAAGGWSSQNLYPRALGDMNGDGRADIVGFGIDGVSISWSYDIQNFTVV